MAVQPKRTVWLFCRVIDNYGDIGVAWRLARLFAEHGLAVVLWHDCATSAAALMRGEQVANVRVALWDADIDAAVRETAAQALPDCVVEMFACDLPDAARELVRRHRVLWLNWEYLSAEAWAQDWHGKASLQADGTEKFFWLMGFTPQSGGLLHERDYAARAQVAQTETRRDVLLRLGVPAAWLTDAWAQERWFCFAYASAIWPRWLRLWAASPVRRECWLAGHQIVDALWQAGAVPPDALRQAGDVWQCGNVRLVRTAFVAQSAFDAVLQAADGVLVRGEDSFVRAQLAGKPLLWHIYPQDEMAHAAKLHAFWHAAYPPQQAWTVAHAILSDALNGVADWDDAHMAAAWQTLSEQWLEWSAYARHRADFLLAQDNSVARVLRRWPQLDVAD